MTIEEKEEVQKHKPKDYLYTKSFTNQIKALGFTLNPDVKETESWKNTYDTSTEKVNHDMLFWEKSYKQ